MKVVDSYATLQLSFTQSMNFMRLQKRNITLEKLKVVKNETEIVPAIELKVISRNRKDEIVQIKNTWEYTDYTMRASVNFSDPKIISAQEFKRDKLFVTIHALSAFSSNYGHTLSEGKL